MVKLFVVGLPRAIEEITVVELFSLHGIVESITIVTDKETGRSKGYGFITMKDQDGADRAIAALDGLKIEDRTLSVRIAGDKKQNPIMGQQLIASVNPESRRKESDTVIPGKKKRPRL